MLSTGAWAQTLQEQINSVADGATITLTGDENLTSTVTIAKTITLNLNGHNITGTGARALQVTNGNVTITGTGTITSTGIADNSSVIRVGDNTATSTPSLTIGENVKVTSACSYGVTIFGKNASETLVVNGTVETTSVVASAISGNGSAGLCETTITIGENAKISAANDVAIYQPQAGTLNVNGIVSGLGGIEIKAGSLIVGESAKITATGTATHNANGDGTSTRGYAIAIVENNKYKGVSKVSVSPSATITGPIATLVDSDKDGFNPTFDGITMVAEVGGTKYSKLSDAIAAATTGETVKLIADVTPGVAVPATTNATLDLNGHKITNTSGIGVQNNGTLTLIDSQGTGVIDAKYPVRVESNSTTTIKSGTYSSVEGAVTIHTAVGATVTIDGGTFSASDNAVISGNGSNRTGDPNNITINGGTFNGGIVTSGYVACGIYAPWKDVITVNGGEFNITNGCGICARAGSVTVNGGEFNCTGTATGKVGDSRVVVPCSAIVYDSEANYPAMTSESKVVVPSTSTATFKSQAGVAAVSVVGESHIEISGGTYSSSLAEDVCADGFVPTANADGTYGVKPGSYVAQIGETKYTTLKEAVNAATAGQTVTLLANINEAVENTNINNLTIALNGKTWTSNSYTLKNNGGTITLTGDGLVKSTGVEGIAVWARTGSIIIEGGNYENCSNSESTVYVGTTDANLAGKQPTITINGGSFRNTADGVYTHNAALLPLTLNIINNIANADAYQAIVINGGIFEGNDPSIGDDSQLNKITQNSNFVASGLHAEKNANGVYEIKEGGYVAQVGYLKYTTLAEAVAVASAEETITLLADAEIESIDLLDGKTIDYNGHLIIVKSFTVIDGAECNIPHPFIAETATYTREVGSNVWGTVCIPFTLDKNNDDYTLYVIDNINGSTLNVTEYPDDQILPGIPVIFHKNSPGSSITFKSEHAAVFKGENGEPYNGSNYLVGTYEQKTITSGLENIYFINVDHFHQAKVSLTVPAYRAYINYTTPATGGAKPSVLNIVVDDNATAIESAVINDLNATEAIYDIDGRQLSAPQKGMNIMKLANGKTIKLFIK